jgi:hypothetical protein
VSASSEEREFVEKGTAVGLDVAKHVMAVHAIDNRGARILRKTLHCDALLAWSPAVPACVMAMEATRRLPSSFIPPASATTAHNT